MIFNVVYWVFGFLRMGTSGMTSQALGRRDMNDVATTLARSIVVAMAVAAFIIILQKPLGSVALALVGASAEINAEAWHYFRICVWGAPAMLCLYSLTGWYIGMQNTRLPMFISIMQNVVNIVASCTFVYAFGMKVEGIALGTLVAQYAGLLVSITLWATSVPNAMPSTFMPNPYTNVQLATMFTTFCIMEMNIGRRVFCIPMYHPVRL
jgi:MATE family multidrug resistance protein